jgi:hypothetical protein
MRKSRAALALSIYACLASLALMAYFRFDFRELQLVLFLGLIWTYVVAHIVTLVRSRPK